jgi:hypothetical protein
LTKENFSKEETANMTCAWVYSLPWVGKGCEDILEWARERSDSVSIDRLSYILIRKTLSTRIFVHIPVELLVSHLLGQTKNIKSS